MQTRDIEPIVAAVADPEIRRFAHLPAPELAAVRAYVEERAPAHWTSGDAARFAIADAETDDLLGGVVLFSFNWEDRRAEIGYWIVPEARGRGVAVRATRLAAQWAFDSLQMKRVEAVTYPDNVGGQRVAERAGFTREGVLRSWFEDDRGRHDAVMFSLLPGE